jgi:cytochrome c oxidase subunit 2
MINLIAMVNCHVRIIVTASDVLHSFAVPSLGIKIDATPGRLNQASFIAERIGTFYGHIWPKL